MKKINMLETRLYAFESKFAQNLDKSLNENSATVLQL